MKTDKKEINRLKDKTFILTITLNSNDIDRTYQKVLISIQSGYENKGFRKGKVPLEIIKSEVSQAKIVEEVLTTLISEIYNQKTKEHDLHPIIQPQIKVLNPPLLFGKDWEIEITSCELPSTSLNQKFKTEISKINLQSINDNEKMNLMVKSLIDNSTTEIPEILINADLDNKMSQLVDQTSQAGMSVNDYLKTKNLTLEQYQNNLKAQITNEWIVNLAIDHIAKVQKIEISESEVKELISKDAKLSGNPNFVYYLLTQQKVFNYLKSLK